jgi:hypothetical protein
MSKTQIRKIVDYKTLHSKYICIPSEFAKQMDIKNNDYFRMTLDNDKIVMEKIE